MSRIRIIIVRIWQRYAWALGACLVGLAVIFLTEGMILPLSFYQSSVIETESFWRDRIAFYGPVRAHEEFNTFVAAEPPRLAHGLAHLFGAALFQTRGVSAIGVCDYRFESGCLHEFFRQAAAAYGGASLVQLEKQCVLVKESGQCNHALGHGMLSSFGYDKTGIVKALEACRAIGLGDPVLGCAGGVFMEYNGYFLLDNGSHPRTPPDDDWYEPCRGIPDVDMRSCVWWLPRWWTEYLQLSSSTPDERFTKIGALCRGLPSHSYERECFEALGQKIPSVVGWNADGTRRLCKEASKTSAQYLYCLSYAASMYITSDASAPPEYAAMTSEKRLPTMNAAEKVCDGLPASSKQFCVAYADNKHYIYNELPLPPGVR